MKEISTKESGSFVIYPRSIAPCLIPSFANGGATATQNGYIITVVTANSHNISSASSARISNTGVNIFLHFNPTTMPPISTQWCSNVSILSANTFTCISTIYQNITTPIILFDYAYNSDSANNAAASWWAPKFSPMAIDIPGNLLKAGSSMRFEFFVERPNLATSRTTQWTVGLLENNENQGLYNGGTSSYDIFSRDGFTSSTQINRHVHHMVGFYGDKELPNGWSYEQYTDFIRDRYSPGQADNFLPVITSSATRSVRNFSLRDGFVVCIGATFGYQPSIGQIAVNDYMLINMFKVEIVQ